MQAESHNAQTNGRDWPRAYLDRVDDGVEDGWEAAAADAHLGLRLEVLEPHLDRGHVDPDPATMKRRARARAQIVKHLAGGGSAAATARLITNERSGRGLA